MGRENFWITNLQDFFLRFFRRTICCYWQNLYLLDVGIQHRYPHRSTREFNDDNMRIRHRSWCFEIACSFCCYKEESLYGMELYQAKALPSESGYPVWRMDFQWWFLYTPYNGKRLSGLQSCVWPFLLYTVYANG